MHENLKIAIPAPLLNGVHHTARPTWKLEETVKFYRDQLGLPLVHAISAKGWGPDNHADFLHFFFDSGCGSTIAFFYYIGTERPEWLSGRDHYQYHATHTAWRVESREQLLAWRDRVEKVGIVCRYQIEHEIIESIYFDDPNGYAVEITWQMRPFHEADGTDAALTIGAAIENEKILSQGGQFDKIDPVWQRKAALIAGGAAHSDLASIYVLDVPEFRALVEFARRTAGYTLTPVGKNYIRIDGNSELRLNRKDIGFNHAVWYGALTGGVSGRITQFDKDEIVIVNDPS